MDRIKEMVRLADGLSENKSLDNEVVARALDCLDRFSQRIRNLSPDGIRVVGTNTLRKATNARAFLDEAEKILLAKLRPQIIPLAEALLKIGDVDNFLMSSVGNSYGDIYETTLDWAKNSKMNQTQDAIPVGHDKYIQPILLGKL